MVASLGSDTRENLMAKFELTAVALDGLSGEGPFFFQADSEEAALEQYMLFAFQGEGAPAPRIKVKRV